MHPVAMNNGKLFFDTYVTRLGGITIVDIGAQDVNGSLREVSPPAAKYIGVDFANARGVDIVLDDPYKLPFEDNSVDVIVSSSCFEHSEMFWLLYLEIIRVLKPEGLFYLNAPSACGFHRYPVDCYRFYPDSGNALAKWGKRNGYNSIALEHYTTDGDYVCVFLKDAAHLDKHPNRILPLINEFSCGSIHPNFDTFIFPRELNGKNLTHYSPHLFMKGFCE
ncbi:MAG: class I SAM-dependent methyltransferase [Aquabacterium sp.]|nr:class I SAM-dependent methyltransferase [Aquabacterium sp.]